MTERLKNIPKQLLDIWNKFTNKQKTLVISVTCIVVFAFVILILLMNKVDYTKLKECESDKEASQIVGILKDEGYKTKYNSKTMTVSVESKKSTDALLLLADNDITTDDMNIDTLLKNSMYTTNGDRILKLNLYMQINLRNALKEMEGIEDAKVYYIPKDTSTNILTNEKEDTSVGVMLTVNEDFKPKTAETIANFITSTIGNENADKIKITDQKGNLLWGGSEDLYSGVAVDKEDYKERLRNNFKNNLYMLLIKGEYDDVEIGVNGLKFNMDVVDEMYTEYTAPEGMEQGLYSYSKNTSSENSNGNDGGVPGTTSNDGTSYDITNDSTSSGSTETSEYEYLPNERVTKTKYESGALIPDESTIGIQFRRIVTYYQSELEASGALNGTTYEAYVAANSALKPIAASPDMITLVSKATWLPEDNIAIRAFEQPIFIPTAKVIRDWTDYLQIALVVLIIGLLIFVVFKSIKPVEVTELEPELSVEQLLATTKENQTIEDIEFNEVSEVRKMIEKFVDEKPEAVAQLLRNWLNEDWN